MSDEIDEQREHAAEQPEELAVQIQCRHHAGLSLTTASRARDRNDDLVLAVRQLHRRTERRRAQERHRQHLALWKNPIQVLEIRRNELDMRALPAR